MFCSDFEHYMCAKFHFVDLAGSERANRTGNVGERFKGNAYSRWYHCFLIYFVTDVFCSLKKVLLVCGSIIFCVNICSWLEHLGMLSCMYCCYQKSVTCKHYVMHFLGLVTSSVGFMARQMQENFRVKGKKLYFGFVDLEKAFDRVPREVISWAMRKLGVEE